MDSRIVSGLIVGGTAPQDSQDSPIGPGYEIQNPEVDPSFEGVASNLLTLRSLPALERYVANFRVQFGSDVFLDYELLIDSDVLRRFVDGAEHGHERDIESAYLRSILASTSGTVCSVPFLPLSRLLNDGFIDLDLYTSRSYLFKVMLAAGELLHGHGEYLDDYIEVSDETVTAFINAYYRDIFSPQPMSWPNRVVAALKEAFPGYDFRPGPASSMGSAFTLGFSAPIREPFQNSLFAAQVRQGLTMANQV